MEKTLSKIINFLMELSGNKIVTIGYPGEEPMKFDISSSGVIGYKFSHVHLFNSRMTECLLGGGTIIVRQFTNMRSHVNNGISIPYKNIYGFDSDGSNFVPIYDHELVSMFSDVESEEKIQPEKGVIYRGVRHFESYNADGFRYDMKNHHLKLDEFDVRQQGWMDEDLEDESAKRIGREIESIVINDIGGFEYTNIKQLDFLFSRVIKKYTRWLMFDIWLYNESGLGFDTDEDAESAFIEDTLEHWLDNAVRRRRGSAETDAEYYYESFNDEIRLEIRSLGEDIFEKMSLGEIGMSNNDIMDAILENEWNIYNAICKIQVKDAFAASSRIIIDDLNKNLYKV
jgi:hypothetical protein